jgi:hypothetical protein
LLLIEQRLLLRLLLLLLLSLLMELPSYTLLLDLWLLASHVRLL